MRPKLFGWSTRRRRVLVTAAIVAGVAAAVGGIALKAYLPMAAHDRKVQAGDTLMRTMPTPADGYLHDHGATRRSGAFSQALADSPIKDDSWNARYGVKTQATLPELSTAYTAQLSQAGWSRDTGCMSKGSADSFATDGSYGYSNCWVKDGFSLTVALHDGRPQYPVWIDLEMTDAPSGS